MMDGLLITGSPLPTAVPSEISFAGDGYRVGPGSLAAKRCEDRADSGNPQSFYLPTSEESVGQSDAKVSAPASRP
jgi:hypothetical protein